MTISGFAFSQQKKTGQDLWHLTIVDSATLKRIDRVTVSINKKDTTLPILVV